jgi:hypothetical protein
MPILSYPTTAPAEQDSLSVIVPWIIIFLHAFSVASFASFAYPRQRRFLESELPLFSLMVSLACPAAGMASAINTIRLGARWQFKKELIDLWLEANSNLLKKRKDH